MEEYLKLLYFRASEAAAIRIICQMTDALAGIDILKKNAEKEYFDIVLNDVDKLNETALKLIDAVDTFMSSVLPIEDMEDDPEEKASYTEKMNELRLLYIK